MCKNRPESPDDLDIALLFEDVADKHALMLDEGYLTINSLPPDNPFHRIALKRIHGIINFEEDVAIALHSSIIFLSKKDSRVNIHIKQQKPSFMDRIRLLGKTAWKKVMKERPNRKQIMTKRKSKNKKIAKKKKKIQTQITNKRSLGFLRISKTLISMMWFQVLLTGLQI